MPKSRGHVDLILRSVGAMNRSTPVTAHYNRGQFQYWYQTAGRPASGLPEPLLAGSLTVSVKIRPPVGVITLMCFMSRAQSTAAE